jgi:acetyltransferase-like isoleucine patch superfamily enzyme
MYKIVWAIRFLCYRLFLGSAIFPGYLGCPLYIRGFRYIFLGRRVRIFPHIRMEAFDGGSIRIHNDVSIAQNVHITSASQCLEIGSGCTILANTYITNIDHEYSDISLSPANQRINVSKTQIGENCFIGFGSAIQAGTILGRHCIVGAHSVVRGVYPDYSVIVGAPARVVKQWTGIEWKKV